MDTEKKGLKAKVQRLGSHLSGMVMPNIGAFIAWGVITALFISSGWLPNEQLATMVDPMIKFLLPLLIGYTGGNMVHGQRGAVVGAIATMGVIVGTDVPMFIGAMVMGPLGGWVIKKFDQIFSHRIRAGFEMLVNNFSAGLLGFALAIIGFYAIGPVVEYLTNLLGNGVEAIINMNLLPLANIFIEPAKVLFLNNAINHGILTPLGTEQSVATGKSILFLLEANPGPGLGVLLAFTLFGKGAAKSSAPGAAIIQFFGGIHEIYFPYIMMKPILFLAVIAGGVSGTFMFQLLGAGLQAAASPGSIIAIIGMTPRDSYLAVIAGVVVAAVVSFLVAMVILKADRSSDADTFAENQAKVAADKAASKGQTVAPTATATVAAPTVDGVNYDKIKQIIFACDAGMGSSAMGASVLRNMLKKAGVEDIPVTNSAINNLKDDANTLIVTQEELSERAQKVAPSSEFLTVGNFMNSPTYDEIVKRMTGTATDSTPAVESSTEAAAPSGERKVDNIIFACDAGMGSSAMGASVLRNMLKKAGVEDIPVTNSAINNLKDNATTLVVTQEELAERAKKVAPSSDFVSVGNFMNSPVYDEIVERMKKQ